MAPWCRKEGCFHAKVFLHLSADSVCSQWTQCMNFMCVCPVHALSRHWNSWTVVFHCLNQSVGPAFMVCVGMMELLTSPRKLLRVPVAQNSPRLAQSYFSWKLQGPGFGESVVWWQREALLQNIPLPLLGSAAPPGVCVAVAAEHQLSISLWSHRALGTERSAASPGSGLCPSGLGDIVLGMCVILIIMHSSSAGVLPHFRQIPCKARYFFFALQGCSPAPFL